ncbi:MAG: glycoside hydrolase family 28 protein [Terriglobales bacterium]
MKRSFYVLVLFLAGSRFAPGLDTTPTPAGAAPAEKSPAVFNVRDYGATGDGTTLDTAAIKKAIEACAAAGGGTVLFPPGQYVTGTIELVSNMTLYLDPGAVILGSKNVDDYGSIRDYGLGKNYGVDSSGEGDRVGLIVARDLQHVAILGTGVIDGRGDEFMDLDTPHMGPDFDAQYTRNPELFLRAVRNVEYGPIEPKALGAGRPGTMLIFLRCKDVLLRDVTLRNSPNWTLHLQKTERAVISGIHILNNLLIPNNDGIDCMACKHIHISDCDIQAGDDDFAIVGSEDVNVSNCSLVSRSSAIRLEDTRFSTFQGLSIATNRGLGIYQMGDEITAHVLFSDITMRTKLIPGHWWGKAEPIYVAVSPCVESQCKGKVSDIKFSNITAEAEAGMLIYGAEDSPVEGISLEGIRLKIHSPNPEFAEEVGGNFDLRWTAKSLKDAVFKHDTPGVYCRWVTGLRIHGLELQWGEGLPEYFSDGISCEDFRDLQIDRFEGRQAQKTQKNGAAISLSRGDGVSIMNSTAAEGTFDFLRQSHLTGHRLLLGDDLSRARTGVSPPSANFHMQAVILSAGAKPKAPSSHP